MPDVDSRRWMRVGVQLNKGTKAASMHPLNYETDWSDSPQLATEILRAKRNSRVQAFKKQVKTRMVRLTIKTWIDSRDILYFLTNLMGPPTFAGHTATFKHGKSGTP